MRHPSSLRCVLAAACVTWWLAALAIGCSGEGGIIGGYVDASLPDDAKPYRPDPADGDLPDPFPTDATGPAETGVKDSGVDVDGSGPILPVPAKIFILHAVTDYGPNNASGIVRICYATKTFSEPDYAVSPLPPLPHSFADGGTAQAYPGIAIGAGVPLPSTGVPIESLSLRPYLLSGQALADRGIVGTTGGAALSRCNRLLAPGYVPDGGFPGDATAPPLAENVDFWKLADIPAFVFANGKSYLLAVTGCTSDANTGAGKCGPDPSSPASPYVPTASPGVGNLRIAILELDRTAAIAADEMGVQVVHLSPQYQALRTTSGGTTVRPFSPVFGGVFDASTYDAASNVRVLGPDASTELAFDPGVTSAALVKLKGIVTTTGYFAANDDDLANGPYLPLPLNNAGNLDLPNGKLTIQYLTEGKTPASATPLYANGRAYTFVLVGDPEAQAGTTRSIHFLAIPNDFTPPTAN